VATLRFALGVAQTTLAVMFLAVIAIAQTTTLVSVDSFGIEGSDGSFHPALSADGTLVAFHSYASNLVSGDTNGCIDVFIHDQSTGTTERVSVDSSGGQANGDSSSPSISGDGRYVAFQSLSSNLVAGDSNGTFDIFVHDRTTGSTECVSVDSTGSIGDDTSYFPAISADGQFVAFYSSATNLVASDTNGYSDIFVHDRSSGTTERVSVDSSGAEANAQSSEPSISSNGQFVVFESHASNLVAGDTNGAWDVFVHDRYSGVTDRLSVDSSGIEGNGDSYEAAISSDGGVVVFASWASNLVPGDSNGAGDIFVHDGSAGSIDRVSVDSSGAEANSYSERPAISADGMLVAFHSGATNLVAGDANGCIDVFVHERSSAITERASVDSSGVEGNADSAFDPPSLSSNGQVVGFCSSASNLVTGDFNGTYDVFVHDGCTTAAAWSNYGLGFSGTNGVPSFAARSNPVLGTTLTLDLANSSGSLSFGLLFLGFQQASIHSALGGDLLVVPALTTVVALLPSGTSLSGTIPNAPLLCGFVIDLQAWESDPGAVKGVSFTQGLELVLGH
jgi:hypothetical protein